MALDALPGSDDELIRLVSAQAEPHQARWIDARELLALLDDGGGPTAARSRTGRSWRCAGMSGQ
ncbi:MAG: hypothetical protein IPO18_08995 [bacterium]|nr:hypothetical protein [bacterium]